MISKPTDTLASLRHATRDVHQRLHRQPVLSCLVQRSLTVDQYLYALHALARFSESIEPNLACSSGAESVRYSSLLRQDYTMLSGTEENPLPGCTVFTVPGCRNTRLGLLYVVLGSRLGGVAIAKNIKRTLALNPNQGATYFGGNESDIKARWSQFVTALDEQCTDTSACVSAALQGFNHLENYLWSLCQRNAAHLIREHRTSFYSEQAG